MLIITSPKYRKRRGRLEKAPPPGPLALVEASYDASLLTLMLKFNQQIDISAFQGSRIRVSDADIRLTMLYGGGGAELLDAVSISIGLVELVAPPSGPGVVLHVLSNSGIAAVNDGTVWAGVSGVQLPYI